MKDNAKLKGKDLINIGIYAAIYCVIMTAVGFHSDHDAAVVRDRTVDRRNSDDALYDQG